MILLFIRYIHIANKFPDFQNVGSLHFIGLIICIVGMQFQGLIFFIHALINDTIVFSYQNVCASIANVFAATFSSMGSIGFVPMQSKTEDALVVRVSLV